MVLQTLDRYILKQALKLGFKASNNKVKYKALLIGLKVAKELQVKKLLIHCDSMLIDNQVTMDYVTHHPSLGLYLDKVKTLFKKFENMKSNISPDEKIATLMHSLG